MQQVQLVSENIMQADAVKWIGIILYKDRPNSLSFCTGVLLTPGTVLAPASCVYSLRMRKKNSEFGPIYVLVGVHGKITKAHKVKEFCFPQRYKQSDFHNKNNFSYALLKLEERVQCQKFPKLGTNYEQKPGDKISLFGYPSKFVFRLNEYYEFLYNPSNSPKDPQQVSSIQQSHKHCSDFKFKRLNQSFFQHHFQTESGEGGSPIVLKRDENLYVIGIHILNLNGKINIGRLITENLAQQLGKWSVVMNSQSPLSQPLNTPVFKSKDHEMKYYKFQFQQLTQTNHLFEKSNLALRQKIEELTRKNQYFQQKFENSPYNISHNEQQRQNYERSDKGTQNSNTCNQNIVNKPLFYQSRC